MDERHEGGAGPPRWRIELLGGVRASRESWTVTRFRTHKAEALLGSLAFHLERAQPRELLTDMLWPDAEPGLGRNSLSRELSSLRQQLEPPGVEPGSVIAAGRTTVRLLAAAVVTDVADFEAALASAARAPREERAAFLRAAVALHRGELLPGHYQDWIEPERLRLRRALVRAARELGAELERAGDRAGAIEALGRATGADPLLEESHRELMTLHAAAGEPGAALQVYASLAATLERELGSAPSPATVELARSIEARAGRGSHPGVRPVRSGAAVAAPVALPQATGLAVVLALAPGGAERGAAKGGEGSAGRLPLASSLEGLLDRHGGRRLEAAGEIRLAAFARPADALACALGAARSATSVPRVRAALDAGVLEGGGPAEHAAELARVARPGTVLVSERTAPHLRLDLGPDQTLVDLGRYRIGGREERILRLEGAGLAADEPAASRVSSAALPLELTRFFGREPALAELRTLLQPGGVRLATLTGPGGIGKTRLALELVTELAPGLRGSVWFVPLAAVRDAALVPEAIAQAMKLDGPSGLDRLGDVARALEGREALLVLDNLEQLGDAAARPVRELLERAPRVACLATSRRRLGIPGEAEVALGPLPVPGGREGPGELARLASVQLFLDRARAVRPDLELTETNAGAIAELVRRLDGIPLALALAAGRAQVLSPEQMLARIGDRFALFASRSPEVPERHRTLAAALEWSTHLLPDELRRLFARLSVFRGAFTLEAAEAVTREPLVLDALSELRECSLLLSEGGPGGGVLFRLLDTIRELVADELPSAERALLERRHAEHYRELAVVAEPLLHGPAGAGWFQRLGAEVLEPARGARARRDDALPRARRARARARAPLVLVWRGAAPRRRGARAPLLAAAPERTADRAAALWALGLCLARTSTADSSRAALEESLAIWRELGDAKMATGVVLTLGEALSRAGEDAAARARYTEGLALARAWGDVRRLGWGLGAFAQHLYFQDELALARSLVEESVALHEPLDVPQHALEQWRLAQVLLAQGESERAVELARRSLETLRKLGFESGAALGTALLGRARALAGDLAGARKLLGEALATFRKNDRPDYTAQTLLELAEVALAGGDLALARQHRDECERVVRGTCEHLFRDRLELLAGDLARASGDQARAREHYRACLEHVRSRRGWNRGPSLRGALEGLAAVESQPRPERAARLAEAAAALRDGRLDGDAAIELALA